MNNADTKTQQSCADDFDPASLNCDEALRRILEAVAPVTGVEHVEIRAALDRVLAADIVSQVNVPAHANSAMDGYAIRSTDIPLQGPAELKVIGTAFAGRPFTGAVTMGECVRIMTGGAMPEGTDTVVIQEQVESGDGIIRLDGAHKAGDNVRNAGEDITAGQTVLNAGRRLMPADIGLFASLGMRSVELRRRVKVAFFSTGDELKPVGEPLGPGDVHDSNRYTLFGMLTRLGVRLTDMGVVRDDRAATRDAFQQAAADHDMVITSGGVSVGEADFVKETLVALGKVNFWKVAMKPGRPLTFGQIGNAMFFGLPGNPVSVMITFYQFVQPALRKMAGEVPQPPLILNATTLSRLKKKPGRVEYQRGILENNAEGQLTVRKTGMQGSGILTSMSHANCFIVLPMDSGSVEPGTVVKVQPFAGLI